MRIRIGRNLHRLRIAKNLHIVKFASAVGSSRWAVQRWEAGAAIPLDKLPMITRVLDASTAQIFPPNYQPILRAVA